MAINKKLIHFSKGENYDTQKNNSNILDSSICFIQDRKTIITHGQEYKAIGWSMLEPEMFPAIIVLSYDENLSNANIAEYFVKTYPDMKAGDEFTPITEEVYIEGTGWCDGKVIGVSNWGTNDGVSFINFFTEESVQEYMFLRVAWASSNPNLPKGSTMEYFYD